MRFFEKQLRFTDENDLRKMEADPMNFESLQIENKMKFDGDAKDYRDLTNQRIQYNHII